MFCMFCGTQLPDEAVFCFKCGKKLVMNPMMTNEPNKAAQEEKRILSNVQTKRPQRKNTGALVRPQRENTGALVGSQSRRLPRNDKDSFLSTRSQKLLYVQGDGLYFLAEWGIGFYSEKSGKVKRLGKNKNDHGLCGIAKYNHSIYYWAEDQNSLVPKLYQVDLALDQAKIVFKAKSDTLPFDNLHEHVFLREDSYYFVDYYHNQLLRFSMDTHEIEKKSLPDMRMRQMPNEWKLDQNIFMLDEEAVNYGNRLTDLKIFGTKGFVILDGLPEYMLSFDLENPSDFEYIKINTMSPFGGSQMMTTIGENDQEIYSTGNGFYSSQYDNKGHLVKMETIIGESSYENARIGKSGKWFVSNGMIYFIGESGNNGFIYTKGKKPYLLKSKEYEELFQVKDFLDIPALGKTYILTIQSLIELPYRDNIPDIAIKDLFSQYVIKRWE